MSTIEMDQIKELRSKTGAGLMDCKEALRESDGDLDDAAKYLREKGKQVLDEKATHQTEEGRIGTYTHGQGKGGVIVEVNCETDFVSQNEEFEELVNEIALQIYGMKPSVVEREDLDDERIEEKKEEFRKEVEDKPEDVIEDIVEGKMEKKFYRREVLLEQKYFKDEDGDRTIQDLIQDYAVKFDENINVRRFHRYEVGEELSDASSEE